MREVFTARRRSSTAARLAGWLLVLVWLAQAAPARADWLVVPFFGAKFLGSTNYIDLDVGSGRTKPSFGVGGGWLSRGLFGVEVEASRTPQFFEQSQNILVTSSSVTTLMGSVMVAVPQRITREGLRPYVIGGLGLMRARNEDVLDIYNIQSNLLGMSVGGGALGFFTDTVGVRFDLRYYKNLTRDPERGIEFGPTQLTYWRASIGLALRY